MYIIPSKGYPKADRVDSGQAFDLFKISDVSEINREAADRHAAIWSDDKGQPGLH